MESFIKFTNQSQGRDRIFRTTQYACALSKYLLRNNSARKGLVLKLQSLESNMSSGRKCTQLAVHRPFAESEDMGQWSLYPVVLHFYMPENNGCGKRSGKPTTADSQTTD
ncbi:peroxisomal membrane protein 11A isoform X2 [Esox lucius]|uniref:peroxisomal membrane protein 11A isoform X2 n=1 Tax=Esox lucius TaxID=8010 RepID=UPI001476B043|nr:peroxisomal membrane protein 11A isoform X2 [Esox lucius]